MHVLACLCVLSMILVGLVLGAIFIHILWIVSIDNIVLHKIWEYYEISYLCIYLSFHHFHFISASILTLTGCSNEEISELLKPLDLSNKKYIIVPVNDSVSAISIGGTHWYGNYFYVFVLYRVLAKADSGGVATPNLLTKKVCL